MKQKDLNKEGITKEFLDSFSMTNNHYPVQLRVGEEPVKLMECAKGYWVVLDFGKYLQDDNGNKVVVNPKEAKIGRARYLLNFASDVFEKEVEQEYNRLIKMLKEKVEEQIRKMRQVLVVLGSVVPDEAEVFWLTIMKNRNSFDDSNESQFEKMLREYEKIDKDALLSYYGWVTEMMEKKDYDSLYIHFCQDGQPIVYKTDKKEDISVLVNMFSVNNVESTIEKLKTKGHVWVIAETNVRGRKK